MPPLFTSNDGSYGYKTNTKLLCQFTMSRIPKRVNGSNLNNLRVVQFVVVCILAFNNSSSSLFIHFSHVIKLGSGPKVNWITATLAVDAGMENIFSFGNLFAVVDNPRNSMSVNIHFQTGGDAVAASGTASPIPALVNFSDSYSVPKSFLEFIGKKSIENLRRGRFNSHNSVRLICATLRDANRRGTFILTYGC